MELDSRFISFEFENKNSFDGWITICSIGNKQKIVIPIKRTKHFNKFFGKSNILKGARLTSSSVTFMFEIEKKEKSGVTIGIDIGSLNVISSSDGQQTPLGLSDIQKKICRKMKGSKAYERALKHRENFINHSINNLDLSNVKIVKRENIKNMKKGVRTSKFLTSWSYKEIFDKLDRYCDEQNVSVIKISPTYTSQRCSYCGWTRKSNRKGKQFKCTQCKISLDADLNASQNIALNLKPIGKKERFLQKNRIGFYWLEEGQEFIAPDVDKNQN